MGSQAGHGTDSASRRPTPSVHVPPAASSDATPGRGHHGDAAAAASARRRRRSQQQQQQQQQQRADRPPLTVAPPAAAAVPMATPLSASSSTSSASSISSAASVSATASAPASCSHLPAEVPRDETEAQAGDGGGGGGGGEARHPRRAEGRRGRRGRKARHSKSARRAAAPTAVPSPGANPFYYGAAPYAGAYGAAIPHAQAYQQQAAGVDPWTAAWAAQAQQVFMLQQQQQQQHALQQQMAAAGGRTPHQRQRGHQPPHPLNRAALAAKARPSYPGAEAPPQWKQKQQQRRGQQQAPPPPPTTTTTPLPPTPPPPHGGGVSRSLSDGAPSAAAASLARSPGRAKLPPGGLNMAATANLPGMAGLTRSLRDNHSACVPHKADRAVRRALIGRLQAALNEVWEGAQMRVFGSSVTGFATVSSDLDLDVISPCGPSSPFETRPAELLARLRDRLALHGFSDVQAILSARVPILKVRCPAMGVRADIAHMNRGTDTISQLLNDYAKCDPRVVPLVLAVKRWANARGVGDSSHGRLSSFSLTLMMVQFLQMTDPPVVPNFQDPRSKLRHQLLTGGFSSPRTAPVRAARRSKRSPRSGDSACSGEGEEEPDDEYTDVVSGIAPYSLGRLLVGFFRCYAPGGVFEPSEMAIAVRVGAFARRAELARLAACICDDPTAPLFVEDPFCPGRNVAHSVRPEYFPQILGELSRARDLLEARASLDELCAPLPGQPSEGAGGAGADTGSGAVGVGDAAAWPSDTSAAENPCGLAHACTPAARAV